LAEVPIREASTGDYPLWQSRASGTQGIIESGLALVRRRHVYGLEVAQGIGRRPRERRNVGALQVQSDKAIDRLADALKSPERAAKIAASKLGKARPAHVHEALKAANVGRVPSDEARANMSAAQKRRGVRPPAAKGSPWKEEEDALLGTMLDGEVAERIGRTLPAVRDRRYLLSIPVFSKCQLVL
jgi:hypothetical protein